MLTADDVRRRLKVPKARKRPTTTIHACESWAGAFVCACFASGDLAWAIRHAVDNQYAA